MLTAIELKEFIARGLPCEFVNVSSDDGQHFEAVVVSPQFAEKNKVQPGQLAQATRIGASAIAGD